MTAHDRWLRILTALSARYGANPTPLEMCSAAADPADRPVRRSFTGTEGLSTGPVIARAQH